VCGRARVHAGAQMRACSLACIACNAFAPIMSSFVAPLAPSYFRHYLIRGTVFGNMLLNIKCVLVFSSTFI
jgi:hypothetical protein